MRYVYAHGFNSGKNSRSPKELAAALNSPVESLEYDYAQPFQVCAAALEDQINLLFEKDVCLMGSSLGGFYALCLRHPSIKKVIAWNPVIYPALQLMPFIGPNVRFSDNSRWILGKDTVLSYARAADPRIWKNFYWDSLKNPGRRPPRRIVFLGSRDDVLDPELGAAYWNGYAEIHIIDSGHGIENYADSLKLIQA